MALKNITEDDDSSSSQSDSDESSSSSSSSQSDSDDSSSSSSQSHSDESSSSSSSPPPPPPPSSSLYKTNQETTTKKRSDEDLPSEKDPAPSPTPPAESDSPKGAPSEESPPPLKSPPPSKAVAPLVPPPPSPIPPTQPPPSPPLLSPPPPSSSPPLVQNSNNPSSSSPPPHRGSSPPQFQAPPPSSSSSSSSSSSPSPSPSRGGPSSSNDSTLSAIPPPASGQAMRGGSSGGGGGGGGSSSSSPAGSSPSSSGGDNAGKYVGYTLGAVFIVGLLVAVAILPFRKRKSKGDANAAPYMPPTHLKFHRKPGVDGLYYGQQPGGFENGPQSPFGSGKNLGRNMSHAGAALDSAQPMSAQIAFTYDMVMEMTDSFSSQNVIGEGGFGCVYKGSLPDNGKTVAVKQLKAGSLQGEREFRAEVEIISRVHHRHLVSLVGYCIAEQQRMLIYEYVPNGTLHHHLHGSGMPVLDWDKRLKIAIGAAKGLAYLHEDCSQKIIHRDIKSANILLDYAFEAQVADFGLARLTDTANTHVSTRVMGTFGYMAPEYATSGKLTDRSDVFSFGVVLLELLTGRKPIDETQPLGDESLVEWARPLLLRAIETRESRALIDPRLENHFVESEMFRMIEAAAACVRHSAPKRPRMVQVVRALDCGDEISDLSNGVKYGQSTVYDSGQYDKDIMLFRRMANGSFVDSDFDMYSREYSREYGSECGSQHALMPSGSSGESESRAFNKHKSSTG